MYPSMSRPWDGQLPWARSLEKNMDATKHWHLPGAAGQVYRKQSSADHAASRRRCSCPCHASLHVGVGAVPILSGFSGSWPMSKTPRCSEHFELHARARENMDKLAGHTPIQRRCSQVPHKAPALSAQMHAHARSRHSSCWHPFPRTRMRAAPIIVRIPLLTACNLMPRFRCLDAIGLPFPRR